MGPCAHMGPGPIWAMGYNRIYGMYVWACAKNIPARSIMKIATATAARRCANTGRVGIMGLGPSLKVMGSPVMFPARVLLGHVEKLWKYLRTIWRPGFYHGDFLYRVDTTSIKKY